MTTGQCPKQYCEPVNGGSSCDDELYCTEKDQCVGGHCKGTPIEDKELPEAAVEVNFAALDNVKAFLAGVGFPDDNYSLKVTLQQALTDHCCESEQQIKLFKKYTLEGSVAFSIGPVTLVSYPPLVFGEGAFGPLALLGSADFGSSASMQWQNENCAGEANSCWQGSGKVFAQLAVDAGLYVKAGGVVLARATVGGKTGIDAGIIAQCTEGQVVGAVFQGVTLVGILELWDGLVHEEVVLYEFVKGGPIPGLSFPLPSTQ
jgi:hypothetical protein